MDRQLERDIQSKEDELTRATRDVDVELLDQLYADDILFTGVTGAVCTKAAIMDEARRGRAERQAAPGAAKVVAYDKDDLKMVGEGATAVTSYRFLITIRTGNEDTVRIFRTTNVWSRRPAGWQVIAAHTAAL